MVYHILADGTVTDDISGHIVKMSDAEALYNLMRETKVHNEKREKEGLKCQILK